MKSTVDITPHPRILQVLGEIEFAPWQCIAELIDNAIDGFLGAKREGVGIAAPSVSVSFGKDYVSVRDNGLGMDLETLELAVKAGWSSQENFGSLGLYGVGFNIATARLGNKTTIWTTRAGDDQWYGLIIDLPQLSKVKNYSLDVRSRPKSHNSQSGTEVEIQRIRSDWGELLLNKNWLRSNVTDKLARIYGTMLRKLSPKPIGFSLKVNDQYVPAWEHCVWPVEREVFRKNEGMVRPLQEFDISFGVKYLQVSTGELLESSEGIDPLDIREIPQRVYGWLGVQRYVDEKEYGIDILRNGRKIEVSCKELFFWEDELEYPIDEQRYRRGRLVGEVHLDHGYVHYTKHRFEREHYSWQQLVKVVKNNQPLTKRTERHFQGVNTSPLGVLFRTFRRNSPHPGGTWKSILFISNNDQARKWADLWRKGVVEYHDEDKWKQALEDSDAVAPPSPGPNPPPPSGPEGTPGVGPGSFILNNGGEKGSSETEVKPGEEQSEAEERTALVDLNLHVTGQGTSGSAYDLEVFAVQKGEPQKSKLPWIARATAKGIYQVDIDVAHRIFKTVSFRVEDAVLSEFAHFISAEETNKGGANIENSYASILSGLRELRSSGDSLDSTKLEAEIRSLRHTLTAALSAKLPEAVLADSIERLPVVEREKVELAHANAAADQHIAEFLQLHHVAAALSEDPAPFFEAGIFRKGWTPTRLTNKATLLKAYRDATVREVTLPLTVLAQFAETPPDHPTRAQLTLVRASLNVFNELLVR
jgi:hypothetical protein